MTTRSALLKLLRMLAIIFWKLHKCHFKLKQIGNSTLLSWNYNDRLSKAMDTVTEVIMKNHDCYLKQLNSHTPWHSYSNLGCKVSRWFYVIYSTADILAALKLQIYKLRIFSNRWLSWYKFNEQNLFLACFTICF